MSEFIRLVLAGLVAGLVVLVAGLVLLRRRPELTPQVDERPPAPQKPAELTPQLDADELDADRVNPDEYMPGY